MVTKKVKKIIRKKLYEYPIYDRLINELELEKDTTEGRDINSSIRSKNKISRTTEGQVIKNISIDSKINEYKKWKELIDNVLQDFRKCDKTKLKIVEYNFWVIFLKILLQMNCMFLKVQQGVIYKIFI